MDEPSFQDRIERNYELGVPRESVSKVWRKLTDFFLRYGLRPTNEITGVGTVYFDNRDFDLMRYTILNPARRMLVRLRAYENYGEVPKPISHYWFEIKTKGMNQWTKKRIKLDRSELATFLAGGPPKQEHLPYKQNGVHPEGGCSFYEEIQELVITMGLRPFFLISYKRLALADEKDERVSLDWDLQYHHVDASVLGYDSWKYPLVDPIAKSQKTILEIKHSRNNPPDWIADLENNFSVQETGFLKFVEGMGFLFRGPLKRYREADYFLRLIDAYGGEGRPLG
jgi:SPX domain protein involved in polyphosphate accumulation